jgi:hypothetical protein
MHYDNFIFMCFFVHCHKFVNEYCTYIRYQEYQDFDILENNILAIAPDDIAIANRHSTGNIFS